MPPEAFKHNPVYSTKLDVFSFGCVIIHTVTQEFPIPDNKYIETLESGKYKELSEVDRRSKLINVLLSNFGGNILYDMVLKCLQDDPYNRPAIEVVCEKLKEFEKLNKPFEHEHHQCIITDIQHDIEKLTEVQNTRGADLHTTLHSESEIILSNEQLHSELQKLKYVPPSYEGN